jgi:hypothetical protein
VAKKKLTVKNVQKRRIVMTSLQKSHKPLIAGAFALSVLGVWLFSSAQVLGAPPSTESEADLKARIAALEATVASLQSQLAAIQANPALAQGPSTRVETRTSEAKDISGRNSYLRSGPFYPPEKWGLMISNREH